jgi:hypothetical protein
MGDPTLARIGAARGCSAAAVALAWVIRNGNVIAIPESGVPAHVKENAVALSLMLAPQDLQTLDSAYPGPSAPRTHLSVPSWCHGLHHPNSSRPNAGHDTRRIQDWLGHRSIQHTTRYTQLSAAPFKDFWR